MKGKQKTARRENKETDSEQGEENEGLCDIIPRPRVRHIRIRNEVSGQGMIWKRRPHQGTRALTTVPCRPDPAGANVACNAELCHFTSLLT